MIPAIVTVPAVLGARAHAPLELARVITTVPAGCPAVEPVALQPKKLPLRVIVGLARIVNAGLKATVIVPPLLRAMLLLVVKPTAQEAVAPAVCGVPTKLTAVTEVAGTRTVTVPVMLLVAVSVTVIDW